MHILRTLIIVYFQENGAAFEAGGLEVGQLILEVDGQKVEGKDFVERRFYTMEGIKAVGESGPSVRPSVW
jgi:C-terminal processing protease CtpA/Prc